MKIPITINLCLSLFLLLSMPMHAERVADAAIESLILQRWSPRAMSGEMVAVDELMRLFEAARWAPSSFNEQPWRFVVGMKDSETWNVLFDTLVPFNQTWAANASALILIISKRRFSHNKQLNGTHSFDTGAAWQNMALQGSAMGLVIHGMAGFDAEAVRSKCGISDEYSIEAMVAVGKIGHKSVLPEYMQEGETPSSRKSVTEFVSDIFIW
jgi:nitroreductase